MLDAIQSVDSQILLFFQNNIRCGFLTPIMKAASWLGDAGLMWIVLAVVLLIFNRTRRKGFDMAVCMALPWVITEFLLKNLIARPRPYLTVPGLELIIEPLTSYSFPSGHACAAFAAATALSLAFRGKGGAWAFVPAALIAISRVYVGIHYPTDVIAGALIGTLGALLMYWLSHKFIKTDMQIKKQGA